MRITALILVTAAAFLGSAGSASAYCIETEVAGCQNPCDIAGRAYRTADATASDALPDLPWNCLR